MPNETNRGLNRALSMLGMARRAGALAIGQDRVLRALGTSRSLVITTEDCSRNVLRKLAAHLDRSKSKWYALSGVTREELGKALGVAGAQIVALPLKGGFADKLSELLQQGGHYLNEQDEGV